MCPAETTARCSLTTDARSSFSLDENHKPTNGALERGRIAKVSIWNRLLNPQEIRALYLLDAVPRDLLAGELLLNEGQGQRE